MNNTSNKLSEISFDVPSEIADKYKHIGKLMFVAYGCLLMENFTEKNYAYYAINLKTKQRACLMRRPQQLPCMGYSLLLNKLLQSPIAGYGQYEIDMSTSDKLSRSRLAEILNHVFRELLPEHEYLVREQQIELAESMLDSVTHRKILLAEAEVGIGKTLAYLVVAALAKRGRVNDFWYRDHYPKQDYTESVHMPFVISTSSITLQNAIAQDYIPEISRILKEHNIIRRPLTCIVRKGKERYICEQRLQNFYRNANSQTRMKLQPLIHDTSLINISDIELNTFEQRRVCVCSRCSEACPCRGRCRYQDYLKEAYSNLYDFQVCNHNYFLADLRRRSEKQSPLIPHYQAVIIDEGHKFIDAARQIYGVALGREEIKELAADIRGLHFEHEEGRADIDKYVKQLRDQNRRLFKQLLRNMPDNPDEEAERFSTLIDDAAANHLHNIRKIADDLRKALASKAVRKHYRARVQQILATLKNLSEKAKVLRKPGKLIYWLEKPTEPDCAGQVNTETITLNAIPKNLSNMLFGDLWKRDLPVVMTSATLSASGNFERTKQKVGLDKLQQHMVMDTRKSSPFDIENNAIIYISDNIPFPEVQNKKYIAAVTREIEQLIHVSHGHTAILFTSYKAMDMVYKRIVAKGLPYPLFCLGIGGQVAIDHFRESENGVLFAAGTLWEGIDLPGDILSMLIIVKLPFAVPGPINEYEKKQCRSFQEYKDNVIVPDMLIKLKQGFGRLIRSETDTGVVALLDSRAATGSIYRKPVLKALPACPTTNEISMVESFLHEKKGPEYFQIPTYSQVGNKLAEGR